MFKFVKDKMENKFINIINAGWIAVELTTNDPRIKAWSFMSENGQYHVTAAYNKKSGKLTGMNGSDNSISMFLASTEEFDVANAFAQGMTAQRYHEATPGGTGVAVKLFRNRF